MLKNTPIRDHDAKVIRQVRKLLKAGHEPKCSCSICELGFAEEEQNYIEYAYRFGWCLLVAAVMLVVSCFMSKAHAETTGIPGKIERYYTDQELATAIKYAENSKKFPYGIRSLKVSSESQARKICLNSIHNAIKRYKAQSSHEDFIIFMGRRYSPPIQNPNWVRLVKYELCILSKRN